MPKQRYQFLPFYCSSVSSRNSLLITGWQSEYLNFFSSVGSMGHMATKTDFNLPRSSICPVWEALRSREVAELQLQDHATMRCNQLTQALHEWAEDLGIIQSPSPCSSLDRQYALWKFQWEVCLSKTGASCPMGATLYKYLSIIRLSLPILFGCFIS